MGGHLLGLPARHRCTRADPGQLRRWAEPVLLPGRAHRGRDDRRQRGRPGLSEERQPPIRIRDAPRMRIRVTRHLDPPRVHPQHDPSRIQDRHRNARSLPEHRDSRLPAGEQRRAVLRATDASHVSRDAAPRHRGRARARYPGGWGSRSAGPDVDGRQPVRHRRSPIPAYPDRGGERAFAGARPGGRADPEHHAARCHAGGSSRPNAVAARPVRGWPESAERAHQPGGTGTDGPAVPGLPETDRRWTARGWRRCGSPGPDPELAGRALGRLQRCGDCQAAGGGGGGVLRRRGRGRTCRQGRCGSGGAG